MVAGKYFRTEEWRRKLSKDRLGVPKPEFHRKAITEAMRRPEVRAKISRNNAINRPEIKIKIMGSNNSQWKGGVSFEPYSKEFTKSFKMSIRKRDDNACILCGFHKDSLGINLDVHHIDYDKRLSIPQNCISLCKQCHAKTQYNRKQWTVFFHSLLSEKYNYEYDKEDRLIQF